MRDHDPKPVALLVADIHLSHKPPVARSAEPDWYAAMKRPLQQLGDLKEELQVPILCAGDIFDRWNSPPELINFALKNLPPMVAVPGQHDLPHHQIEDLYKSAYGILEEVEIVCTVGQMKAFPTKIEKGGKITEFLRVWGFPWGAKLKPLEASPIEAKTLDVALIHSYCWIDKKGYPGAPQEQMAYGYRKKMEGYTVLAFGDNHQHFQYDYPSLNQTVYNCGTLIPRKIDERHHKPSVGILLANGNINKHVLDTSKDKWLNIEEEKVLKETYINMESFINQLSSLEQDALDFQSY